MSLPLTAARLAAVYECLRSFPPLSRLGLPQAEHIEFRVSRSAKEHGHYQRGKPPRNDEHRLSISSRSVGQFASLAWVMAHEMIHLSQGIRGTETAGTQHNAEFHRIAKRVCRRFGFDLNAFV
ncbi:MAG: hypothetical protein DDT20_00831 [Firmicutes bacterium]|nr:hypothetical protein [Bacillota bacterium]